MSTVLRSTSGAKLRCATENPTLTRASAAHDGSWVALFWRRKPRVTISSDDPWMTQTGTTAMTPPSAAMPRLVCTEPKELYCPVSHSASTGTLNSRMPASMPARNFATPRSPRKPIEEIARFS
jgi:hypothetical protein